MDSQHGLAKRTFLTDLPNGGNVAVCSVVERVQDGDVVDFLDVVDADCAVRRPAAQETRQHGRKAHRQNCALPASEDGSLTSGSGSAIGIGIIRQDMIEVRVGPRSHSGSYVGVGIIRRGRGSNCD